MKKFNVSFALLVVAVCAMLSLNPMKAYADTVTLTLDGNSGDYTPYSWVSNGTTYSEPVGPYMATLSGGGYDNTHVLVICYDMKAATNEGQTYTGTVVPVTTFIGQPETDIMKATYLANELMTDGGISAPSATRGAISTAIWQIMNDSSNPNVKIASFPDDPAAIPYINEATTAVSNGTWTVADANQYSTWMPDSNEIGVIQRFDIAPTPEPGSLLLLGTGMFGFATMMYRRKRVA